jgi:hypothetical protein
MSAKILKKITLSTMGLDKMTILEAVRAVVPVIEYKDDGKTPKVIANKGPAVAIAQFVGNVTAIKPGANKDTGQPFVKLIGSYEAINLLTGESFTNCSTLLLPDFIANGIATAIMAGAGAVDFAVKVSANYDEKSAVSYEFSGESLMPTQEADAVSSIKARLQNMGVLLAAPKPVLSLASSAPVAAAPVAQTEPAPETAAAAPAVADKPKKKA